MRLTPPTNAMFNLALVGGVFGVLFISLGMPLHAASFLLASLTILLLACWRKGI